MANNCGNVHVRFSTFFILENVGKIKKNVKKRKKRDMNKKRKNVFTSMIYTHYTVYTRQHPASVTQHRHTFTSGLNVNWKTQAVVSTYRPTPAAILSSLTPTLTRNHLTSRSKACHTRRTDKRASGFLRTV